MTITMNQMNQLGWKLTSDGLDELNKRLQEREEMYPNEICHFLSQVSHESGCGRYKTEIWGPTSTQSRYEGRKDLGNTQSGDGYRFRGGGYIQLTGRANYTAFSKFVNDSKVMDGAVYVGDKYPWTTAFYFWDKYVHKQFVDMTATVLSVTKRINGGTNGLQDRQKYYDKAVKIFITNNQQVESHPAPPTIISTIPEEPTMELPIKNDIEVTNGKFKINNNIIELPRILFENRNYVQLDSLRQYGLDVEYNEKENIAIINIK